MNYKSMVVHYEQLCRDLSDDDLIAERIGNKLRFMRRPLYAGGYSPQTSLRIAWRLLTRGILPGGPRRWLAFLRTLRTANPRQMPTVIPDRIIGLSMADFARRRFTESRTDTRRSGCGPTALREATGR